jgi:hypothetical protein
MTKPMMPVWVVVVAALMCAAPLCAQQDPNPNEPAAAEETAVSAEVAPVEDVAVEEPPATENAPAEAAPAGTEFPVTLDFSLTGPIALVGTVGEVEIRSVEFLRGNVKTNVIKGAFSSGNEDLKSELTVRLSCATTAEKKWKLDVMVELLDADGNVIDRASDGFSLKNEAKILELKHTTLAWVVPHIASARLSITGEQ